MVYYKNIYIYVILTGEDILKKNSITDLGSHHDIDILVVNHKYTKMLLNAANYSYYYDEHYRVGIGKNKFTLGIYELGDCYFDPHWQLSILNDRVKSSDGYYVIDKKNHFYWILYHALCQRRELSKEYRTKIADAAEECGIVIDTEQQMWELLESFLISNNYNCVYPKVFLEKIYTRGFRTIRPIGYEEWRKKRLFRIPVRIVRKVYRHCLRK